MAAKKTAKKTTKSAAKKTAKKTTGSRAAARRAAEQEADDRSLQNLLGGGPHPDDVAGLAARRAGTAKRSRRT